MTTYAMPDPPPAVDAECDGMCLTGSDIGVPSAKIAYPHPGCPLHAPGEVCGCGQPDRCNSPTHNRHRTEGGAVTDFDPAAVALALVRQTIFKLRYATQQEIDYAAGEYISGAQADDVRKHLPSWVIRLESVLPHRERSTP